MLLGVDPDFFRLLAVNVRGGIPFLSRVSVGLRGVVTSVLASLAFGGVRLLMHANTIVLCLALCRGLSLPLPSSLTWSLGLLGLGFSALDFKPDFCFLLFNMVGAMLFGREHFALPRQRHGSSRPPFLRFGGGV